MKLGESIEGWIKEELLVKIPIDDQKSAPIIIKKCIKGKEEDWYVREYIDGVPENLKGIQLFDKAAAKNLNLTKLLPTHGNLQKMVGKRMWWYSDAAYKKNNNLIKKFIEENKLLNTGFYSVLNNCLFYVDTRIYLLSQNDRTIEINTSDDQIDYWYSGLDKGHGYAIMLIEK